MKELKVRRIVITVEEIPEEQLGAAISLVKAKLTEQLPKETDMLLHTLAQQILDIANESEHNAELVATDLDTITLQKVAAELKKAADKNKHGNQSAVSPEDADTIIRTAYGLPERNTGAAPKDTGIIDIGSFLL